MFWSVALAQGAAQPRQPSMLDMLPMLALMFLVFYIFIIRPQSKRQRKQQDFIANLKRGDTVITSGGIWGTVEGISDKFVTLEVADDVRIKVLKTQIATSAQEGK